MKIFFTSISITLFVLDAIFAMYLLHLRSVDKNTPRSRFSRSRIHSDTSILMIFSVVRLSMEYSDLRFLLQKCISVHLFELSFINFFLAHFVTESMFLCNDSTLDSSSNILIILRSSAYSKVYKY